MTKPGLSTRSAILSPEVKRSMDLPLLRSLQKSSVFAFDVK